GLGVILGEGRQIGPAKAHGQRERSKAGAHLHLLGAAGSIWAGKSNGLDRQREPFRATSNPAILKNSDPRIPMHLRADRFPGLTEAGPKLTLTSTLGTAEDLEFSR